MELVLELEMSKKKNQELQKVAIVQKMENEQLLKQCRRHELLNCNQSDTISELEEKINELLSHIKVSSVCHFICHCSALPFCPVSQLPVLQDVCHCT
jgi:hypothetical protein